MASTRDKNRARALMRANPDLNYTAALRQVQADRDAADRPHAETTEIVLDEAFPLTRQSPAAREAIARALAAAEAPTISLGDLPPGSLDPFASLAQDAPTEEEAGVHSAREDADRELPDITPQRMEEWVTFAERLGAQTQSLRVNPQQGGAYDPFAPNSLLERDLVKSKAIHRMLARMRREREVVFVVDDPQHPDGVRRIVAEVDPSDAPEGDSEA